MHKLRSKRRHWWPIFGFCFGAVLIYVSIMIGRPEPPLVPGWEDLGRCIFTMSFDGMKELALSDNHQAVLYDLSKKEYWESPTIEGTWSFDETTHRYALALNDVVTTYSVVAPRSAVTSDETVACVLVKGDLGAADMRASWFSPVIDDHGD